MASPIDEGLAFYRPGFPANGRDLLERLAAEVGWDDHIRARRVASVGAPYNYSGTVWPETPAPALLIPFLRAVVRAVGYEPNNCQANYYPDGGSTMGYHSDSVAELEPATGISIVSLGAPRAISFRRAADRSEAHELVLDDGSLLHMTTAMQAAWRHAVLRAEGLAAGRISLTIRRIARPSPGPDADRGGAYACGMKERILPRLGSQG